MGLVLPTAAAREWKEEKEKKERRKIATRKEEIPAREGQAGRWGRPDGGSACACLDGQ